VAFAYAPWRLEQDGHLHVLSSGGIPLALFLLLRGYRRDRPGTVLAGWLVAAWQISLGFTLGLQLAYLLGALGLAGLVWSWRRRPLPPAVLAATLCGVIAVVATAALLSRPYMQVLDDHPEAHRTRAQVAGLSPPVRSFIAAPEQNLIWGKATKPVRDELSSVPEQTLFPGIAILALALLGVAGPPLTRPLRWGLGLAALACAVLSLGLTEHGGALLHPYRLLFDHAPGWSGVRVPGRLTTLTSLALALLAAAGADRLAGGVARRRSAAVAGLLVLAVLVEGSGFDLGGNGFLSGPSHPRVPVERAGAARLPAPQLHLPITTPANRRYVLWSTDRFPKLVNGRGSFEPRFFVELTRRVERFPDRSSVATLRSLGVRTVVLHRNLAPGTVWERAPRRSIDGLGISRVDDGELVVYRISRESSAEGRGGRPGP
jgi:hypothetical protein